MTRTTLRSLSFAIAVVLATPVFAVAQTDDAATLDAVRVLAPIPRDTGTATKTDTPLIEVPQSLSIITARDLQDRGLHNEQNLSDKEYVSTCNSADGCCYGYPRTLTATAHFAR